MGQGYQYEGEGENINIQDIRVEVTCPACKRTYGITLKKPLTTHNCRCQQGGFSIRIVGMGGKKARVSLGVQFTYNNTRVVDIQIADSQVTIVRS